MKGLLVILWLVLVAPLAAEPYVRGSEVLTATDRDRLGRSVLFTEELLRNRSRGFSRIRGRSAPSGPLSPDEACGACGTAGDLVEFSLMAQGVPRNRVFDVGADVASNERAYAHVFEVYRTTGTSGEPLMVIIDPTFSQAEAHSFLNGAFEAGGHTPGQALAQDPIGREILNQIRTEGYWIPTRESFQVWQRAITRDPRTGAPGRRFAMTWEEFQATERSNPVDYIATVAYHLGIQNPDRAELATVMATLRERLSAITSEQLAERRRVGLTLSLPNVRCAAGFVPFAN